MMNDDSVAVERTLIYCPREHVEGDDHEVDRFLGWTSYLFARSSTLANTLLATDVNVNACLLEVYRRCVLHQKRSSCQCT